MRNTMIVASLGIFLPLSYLLIPGMGNHGLWLSLMIFLLARGAIMSMYAPRAIFRKF
jgi:MATE family multidrug resistance protein